MSILRTMAIIQQEVLTIVFPEKTIRHNIKVILRYQGRRFVWCAFDGRARRALQYEGFLVILQGIYLELNVGKGYR
jgi:hypothetical protein